MKFFLNGLRLNVLNTFQYKVHCSRRRRVKLLKNWVCNQMNLNHQTDGSRNFAIDTRYAPKQIINGYSGDNIYSADETALLFQAIPH